MVVCPQCGSELPDGARFCPACGTAVAPVRGEERKVVTILFADLVDSTVLGDNRDPEELRAAVLPQIARMRTELERFGGTFEKYVGDAVMAVFGAPTAHEDDAERAVRAALAIRDAIAGVKVAVNTGEAVVQLDARSGAGEGIATGDVVTTTFRIEEAAVPASVLVGESTFRATQGVIEYSERKVLQAKGKAHPIAVYEARRAATELRPAYGGPPLAPLVGRKEELALILDTLARARRDRTVQLLTLVGVPGIGKSRLVWELQRTFADEPNHVTWLRGRCLPYGDGVTYWALGEMVKAQAGILETDDSETAAAKLARSARAAVPFGTEAAWVESHLRTLLALEGDVGRRRDEAFAAWRRYVEALAEPGPLVLVFEDLHWADDGLLDFIDHVADWSIERPIVLLCTARPELRERRAAWGARMNAATILLPPLSTAETGTLVELLLRQTRVPKKLRTAVLSRSEGNPLYAEEFVRMLVDRGLLVRNGGGWELRAHDLPVPDSVHAIIAARLDTLPTHEKAVLRDASVVGRGFWPNAVAAVCGFAPEDVNAYLRSLERKELVRRRGSSAVADEMQYSFHHALVRDVAYAQIPRAERADKHRLAAEWIDALGRPQDHSETIAHHYLEALEYARQTGQDESAFAERAQSALRDAGDRALALNSFGSAERFYAAAVDLSGDEAPPKLLFRLGSARFRAVGTGGEVLERAYAQLLERGDVELAAEAEVMLAEETWMQGRRDAGFEHLEHAAALLRDAPATRSKAYVLCSLARFLRNDGRDDDAIGAAREAMAMAEQLGLDELCANALCTLGVARAETGDLGGVEDLERSIAIAQAAGSPESVRAFLNLGSILARLGDLPRAFALHAEGHQAAERFGDLGGLRWLEAERLYEDFWSGRSDEALQRAGDILREVEAGTSHRMELDARLIRGWIRLERGNVDEAEGDARRALEFARGVGDPQALFPALSFAARVAAAAGREAEATAIVDELLRSWDGWALALPSTGLADLGIVAHDVGRAEELVRVASGKTATRWLDAALAAAKGEFLRASELYHAIGSVPDEEIARRRARATVKTE
ncbi:MAG TPA: AAA family ATPase [Gaiellaceae bacterium]|nr:AAA family ATPase [Gaiellaceae bacterium]